MIMVGQTLHDLRASYGSKTDRGMVNTLKSRRNGQHFADVIFKHIFFNENVWISIKISLKFVPNGLINNIPALVLIMAWRRPGYKPLSEPMIVRSLTHICVTWPQWVNEMASENWWMIHRVNSSSPEQNSRHFADHIFNRIFLKEKGWFLTKI